MAGERLSQTRRGLMILLSNGTNVPFNFLHMEPRLSVKRDALLLRHTIYRRSPRRCATEPGSVLATAGALAAEGPTCRSTTSLGAGVGVGRSIDTSRFKDAPFSHHGPADRGRRRGGQGARELPRPVLRSLGSRAARRGRHREEGVRGRAGKTGVDLPRRPKTSKRNSKSLARLL
jgi:hypothetical protein